MPHNITHFTEVVTPPASEPITLAEAKAHLRVDTSDDDALINALVVAARECAEQWLRRALLTTTFRLNADSFPIGGITITLDNSPVQSVTSIKYDTETTDDVVFDPSNFNTDLVTEPSRIVLVDGGTWPETKIAPNVVRVEYVSGYASASVIPQPIIQGMLLMIGDWYEFREDSVQIMPKASERLMGAYRVFEF